jgi:hypothetical protein
VRTVYPFILPRGYLGPDGTVHRDGVMRLATGRDELEPLRDPFVKGPDDPRLTMLVLARVIQRLGTIEYVTLNEIEGLFAADLAFLQDFYSVVNFGDQEEFEALLSSAGRARPDLVVPDPSAGTTADSAPDGSVGAASAAPTGPENGGSAAGAEFGPRPGRVPAPPTRRDAILEVTAAGART